MFTNHQLESLLGRYLSNREDLDQLLALYRPAIRLMAEQMIGPGLRRREDASDIAQRTVMEAYAAGGQFRGTTEMEFSAWLKQILRRNVANIARDHRAAKRDCRKERFFDDGGDDTLSVNWKQPPDRQTPASQMAIKAEAALRLAMAIDELPEDQRTAVKMRHLDGCGIEEISQAMEKTAPAVAGLIRRGLQAMRANMSGVSNWL